MTRTSNPITRILAVFGRGHRRWYAEPLMPSVLFDLNRSLGEDIGIVPQDAIEASAPRARGRRRSR